MDPQAPQQPPSAQPPPPGAPPQQEGQGGGGRAQPLPELVSLREHPGDLALLANTYISKLPPESVKELAIQLYLHSLASDPQIQGADHAIMVAQQHIQEADLAKKGPKAAGPAAQVGPAAGAPQPGAGQPIAAMGPGSAAGAPKMAFDFGKAFDASMRPIAQTNAMVQSALPTGLGSLVTNSMPGLGAEAVSTALDKADGFAKKNPASAATSAAQPAKPSVPSLQKKSEEAEISSFSYEKFSSSQLPFARQLGVEFANLILKGAA